MNHSAYINNLYESFIQGKDRTIGNVMLIKHYNTFSVSIEEIQKIVEPYYKEGLLYHHYKKNDIKDPYEPFMSGIRLFYYELFVNQYTVEEFIEKCNVYSLQKEIFISYIKTGKAVRTELLLLCDVIHEKKKFINSIISCYNFMAGKYPILIVIDRLQLAGISGFRVIQEMIRQKDAIKFRIVLIYNELFSTLPYSEEEFSRVVEMAFEKNILFEWEGIGNKSNTDYHTNFIPTKRYFSDYLEKLMNLFNTIEIEDAEYYENIIYQRIVQEKLSINDKEKFDFFAIKALINIYNNNTSAALLICEKLLPLFNKKTDLFQEYTYNYLCALAQMTMTQSELALDYSKECQKVAKIMNDDLLIFNADMIYTMSKFCGWVDVFSTDFSKVTIDDNMVARLKKYKYKNILAYYLAFGGDNNNEDVYKIVISGTNSQTFEEAISIGKELENTNFLLSAYTKYIVIFTEMGYHKYINKFYQKKLQLLKLEMNTRRQANLYLGMSYNSIINEQYLQANEYINNAISITYKLNNPEFIAEALYNLVIDCICARDYYHASEYLQTIFAMVNNLGYETIQICNTSKLYGLLAFSYYRMGNEYQCYLCLSKIEVQISHILDPNEKPDYSHWHEDLFLYYFTRGMMEKDRNPKEALKLFEKADSHYKCYPGSRFYCVVEFTVEYVKLCNCLGLDTKADNILDESINYCKKSGYVLRLKSIMLALENRSNRDKQYVAVQGDVSIKQMLDLSFNIGKQLQLNERKKDINFLCAWQEMLNKDDIEEEKLIENSMVMLQNNFNLDEILILSRKNGQIKSVFKMKASIITKENFKTIFKFFDATKRSFIINRTDKAFIEYEDIISIFGKHKVVTLIGIPLANDTGIFSIMIAIVLMHNNFRRYRSLLNNDNLIIMKTAFVQLNNDLERIKNKKNIIEMNQKLKELAITDMLTGLYNRQGFAKMIEEDSNCNNSITILYADLDNFKYYNDTFGHDVGDQILVEFAKLFNKVCKKIGYAVRYGGDEFVIVLKNVSVDDAVKVAEDIYEDISDGFVDVVRSITNKEIEIPDNKRVSCSIGIASTNSCNTSSISDTLQHADIALYYIKKNHKGSYFVWED